jgi:hypothetical protein
MVLRFLPALREGSETIGRPPRGPRTTQQVGSLADRADVDFGSQNEFTRWGFGDLVACKAMDIVQPDGCAAGSAAPLFVAPRAEEFQEPCSCGRKVFPASEANHVIAASP